MVFRKKRGKLDILKTSSRNIHHPPPPSSPKCHKGQHPPPPPPWNVLHTAGCSLHMSQIPPNCNTLILSDKELNRKRDDQKQKDIHWKQKTTANTYPKINTKRFINLYKLCHGSSFEIFHLYVIRSTYNIADIIISGSINFHILFLQCVLKEH